MALFRSKTELNEVKKLLELELKHVRILHFDGDSSEKHMKLFSKLETLMDNFDGVFFTSKITVSADVQYPFDAVFAYCKMRGCTYRDITQMIGRCRRLNGPVYILHNRATGHLLTVDETSKVIEDHRQMRTEYGMFLFVTYHPIEGISTTWCDKKIIKTLAYQKMEQESCFRTNIGAVCAKTGDLTVEVLNNKQTFEESISSAITKKEAKTKVADEIMRMWHVRWEHVKTLDDWDYERVKYRATSNRGTNEDRADVNVMLAAGHFWDTEFRNGMNANQLKCIGEHLGTFKNAKYLFMTKEERHMKDLKLLQSKDAHEKIRDEIRMRGKIVQNIVETCALIGFPSFMDHATEISMSVLHENKDALSELHKSSVMADHGTYVKIVKPIFTVRAILAYAGLELHSRRSTKREDKNAYYVKLAWKELKKINYYEAIYIGHLINQFDISCKMVERPVLSKSSSSSDYTSSSSDTSFCSDPVATYNAFQKSTFDNLDAFLDSKRSSSSSSDTSSSSSSNTPSSSSSSSDYSSRFKQRDTFKKRPMSGVGRDPSLVAYERLCDQMRAPNACSTEPTKHQNQKGMKRKQVECDESDY